MKKKKSENQKEMLSPNSPGYINHIYICYVCGAPDTEIEVLGYVQTHHHICPDCAQKLRKLIGK